LIALVASTILLGSRNALAADPPRARDQHFTIDPVTDIVLSGASGGVSILLSLILQTGEIKASPLQPGDENKLLSIDRGAVTQTLDGNADTFSTVGLYTAVGFAVLDPFLSAYRDGWDAGLVDLVMYAETISITEALTDITKIAVRRPRPIDYLQCERTSPITGSCSNTDLQLSFFSGHAATVAAITGTASYLAFVRSPDSPRPWITLGLGTALTAFVGYERVRSGEHFPTDVLAGALAGASVGVLVPHLHRHVAEPPPVWVGVSPVPGGAVIGLQGATP
jgi:undecaprenyl-diphosphatase